MPPFELVECPVGQVAAGTGGLKLHSVTPAVRLAVAGQGQCCQAAGPAVERAALSADYLSGGRSVIAGVDADLVAAVFQDAAVGAVGMLGVALPDLAEHAAKALGVQSDAARLALSGAVGEYPVDDTAALEAEAAVPVEAAV